MTSHQDERPTRLNSGGSSVLYAMLLAGFACTFLMFVRSGPSSASAAVEAGASLGPTSTGLISAMGSTDMKTTEKLLRSTQKTVQQFATVAPVAQVALADLKANPFRRSLVSANQNDAASDAVKSEQRRHASLQAVQNLQLQSVLVNDKNRSCMINNGLYLEGQQVDQFTIESIRATGVVVRTGIYRFELRQH